MFWYKIKQDQDLRPKYIVNAFPKAGLHLVEMIVQAICEPQPGNLLQKDEWIGTFMANSWSGLWKDERQFMYKAARLQPGYYMKGHIGYTERISNFLADAGVAMVFVIRDLRDVAVSTAHHVISGDKRREHPAKNAFRLLDIHGGFDLVLTKVIEGMTPFPGIFDRWEYYEPWLRQDWVLKVRFEDALENPQKVAEQILGHGIMRTFEPFKETVQLQVDQAMFADIVKEAGQRPETRQLSPTFRSGKTGEWKQVFKPEHVELFERLGKNWLEDLGYEPKPKE